MSSEDSRNTKKGDDGAHGPQGTVIIDRSDLPGASDNEGSAVGSQPIGEPVLLGLTPPFDGQRFPIDPEFTQVGRKEHNTVVLDDPSVSWEHAHIQHSNGHWRVLNVLSTNGTFVNGWQVHESRLADGDRLAFGNVAFEFRLHDDKEGTRDRAGRPDGAVAATGPNRNLLIGAGIAVAVIVIGVIAIAAL